MTNILFAVVIALAFYGLLVSLAHMPFFATFLLIPLLLCGVMMMFMMGHGEDKKEHTAHKH